MTEQPKGTVENSTVKVKKKGGCLKGCLTIIVIFILLGALISACSDSDSDEDAKKDEVKKQTETVKSTAKKAVDPEEIAAEKAAEQKKLAVEKEFYINEVKSKIDVQMKLYDAAWNELWVPTFEGLGTSVNIYTAYDNMNALNKRYSDLYSLFSDIEGKNLSKENQKQLKAFTEGMKNASMWRSSVAKKAMKIFDEGEYNPSKMNAMKSEVQYADSEMMSAVVALTTLENNLGIEHQQ